MQASAISAFLLAVCSVGKFIGEALHFELAIKFYLQTTRGSIEPRDFMGPRAQDRLDIKLDRLFQKQLRRLETAAGRQAIPPELQNMPMTSRALVQGGLFHPIDVWLGSEKPSPPKGLARAAPLGWWVPVSVRPPDTWPFLKAEKWTILPKLEWMSQQRRSRHDPELEDALSFWKRSQREIEERGRAMLVVGFTCDETHGGWHEVTRGFLVPKNWPHAQEKS